MSNNFIAAISVTANLAGCALLTVSEDPASSYYMVPVGSVLEVHETLHIEPGTTRVWLVRGRAAPGRDWYATSCNLEVGTLDRNRVQTIQPGQFKVGKVERTSDRMAIKSSPVQVAAMGTGLIRASGQNSIWQGYHLWLESETQPDVRRLTCMGSYLEPKDADLPSINEMRHTFGKLLSLHLP